MGTAATYSRQRHRHLSRKRPVNHNLEEQARLSFNDWCSKCREVRQLSDLCDNILDYTPSDKLRVLPLNSSDVTEGIFSNVNFCPLNEVKGQFKKRFQKGDVLYSEIRPRNHHYAFCYFEPDDYLASTRLMIIRSKESAIHSPTLLYQYLLMPQVLNEFTAKTESRSGTFPQGNYKDLTSSSVPYNKENADISNCLDSFYTIVWNNYEENAKLTTLRDSLIQRLLSGELKINDLD